MTSFDEKMVKEYERRLLPKVNSRKTSQAKIDRIIKLTNRGLFRNVIAEKVSLNPWTVYKYQKENRLI